MRTQVSCKFPGAKLLVVDDNAENLRVVGELLALMGYCNVTTVSEPGRALDLVRECRPDLILLDLLMPRISGFDILEQLRETASEDDFLPVLVFTADNTPAAKARALNLGASDFITKPFNATELVLRIGNFLRMRHMHMQLRDRNNQLDSEVQKRTADLERSRLETLSCLARAAEYRDDATGEHTKRVGELSARIAQTLGLPNPDIEVIRLAAPLHDLGKIGVPDAILLKPGKLTDREFQEVMLHPVVGASIIGDCSSPVLKKAKEIALHHHERWDGKGYPDGLVEQQIPVSCRIVAVADMYDALRHERPYKPAWPHAEAEAAIQMVSGRQLDPEAVEAFISLDLETEGVIRGREAKAATA
jgi:putative two-component system response regulator